MGANGKALLAAAIAGLVVIGAVHWWNRRDVAVDEVATVYAGLLELSATARTESLGPQRLKGLPEDIEVYRVTAR